MRNWTAPHDVFGENPKVGTTWGDIDFGGASPSSGVDLGGLYPEPTWLSYHLLGVYLSPYGFPPDGPPPPQWHHLISLDYQYIAYWFNEEVVPALPGLGLTALPQAERSFAREVRAITGVFRVLTTA